MWPAAGNVGRGRGVGGGDVGVGGEAPTPGWPGRWPVNQNMYQNIPHEQIDWAALAQQWIQMRETEPPGSGGGGVMDMDMGTGPHFPGLQHGLHDRLPVPHHLRMANAPLLPPGPHSHAGPPLQQQMTVVPGAGHQHQIVRPPRDVGVMNTENSNARDVYGTSGDWSSYWSSGPGWGPNAHPQPHQHMQQQHAPNWAPPTAERKDGAGSFDYGGHLHGNHGYAAQTYDYNHGTDHIGLSQGQVQSDEHAQFNQFWSSDGGGPSAPPFLRRDVNEFVDQVAPGPEEDISAMPALDAAKRKNLPAWIRDGLEKMERDKQKKVEREEMLVQRELRLQAQRMEEEKAVREFHSRGGQRNEEDPVERNAEAVMPSKSKFESDSEGGGSDDEGGESDSGSAKRPLKSSPSRMSRTPTPPPFEAVMTEQERTEEMMNKVRRLLTEILLEVTNEEIGWIAKEVFSKARAKAPARQLAKSSALASITGSLGLGGYSSGSDDSEGGEKDGDGGDDVDDDVMDSDAELQEKIHRRRMEFALRERELYGDDESVDSDHSVSRDQQSREESAYDTDDRKEGFEESTEKDEIKSKDRSEFERNWYSEDKIIAPDATVHDTSSTVGSVEFATANANQTNDQLGSKRESAKDDDNEDDAHFVHRRRSDAKRLKKSDSSGSRSQSRDRSGDKRGSVSHRSSRRHRSGSRSPEKRPRRDSGRSPRGEMERTKSGYGNRHRRTRSKSMERAKSRRSRSRSRDGHRIHASIKRRNRSWSSSSSASSNSRRVEKKKRRERDKGRSTTMKKMSRRSESESSSSKSNSSKSSSRRRRRTVSSSSKRSTGTKRRDSRSEIKSGRSRNK